MNPNLKDKIYQHIWFYFEYISKSITESVICGNTKEPITNRCFKDISTIISRIVTEICIRYFNEFDNTSRLNSSLAFFVRDLIGVLPHSQILHFVKLYNDPTTTTVRGNVGQCEGLKEGVTDRQN